MKSTPAGTPDFPTRARERVQVGPSPEWIVSCPYEAGFKVKVPGAVTFLLIERQEHAELGQTYVHTAMRLETPQAVQHHAQWRLEFEPQTQSLLLHSIKIRRGSAETERLALERIQFLQREAGLEGCVIDGWVTLLLLLEDVSPGDILEWSYTLTNRPRLLPQHVSSFFTLPAGAEIGKFHFSVRHAGQRSLEWKASSPELSPVTGPEGPEVRCVWQKEQYATPEPEPFTPAWQLDFAWIQVSDCPDWQTVGRAVGAAWKEENAEEGLPKLVEEIKAGSPELLAQVNRAVELVQDDFRYLSVNLELGGQIPADAETVIRRRYGDCKDLAFLLVRILRGLGVAARPVLVNLSWGKAIAGMLPSPGIFNHVVVEFEVENEKRWVDATAKCQGGGALKRWVADLGFGLPIGAATSELVPVPKASLPWGSSELKETFILDTANMPSHLAIVVSAKGVEADTLRSKFTNQGVEAVARERLQLCADRFCRARRVGQLLYRDERELNEFVLAESFEIEGFLKQDEVPDTCLFFLQELATAGALAAPSEASRRNPFALPFPCQRVHIIELEFTGLAPLGLPQYQTGNEFFSFSRRTKELAKFLKITYSFNTVANAVPPGRVEEHRKRVEPVWKETAFRFRLPVGYAAGLRRRSDFGALPPPVRPPLHSRLALDRKAPPSAPPGAAPAEKPSMPPVTQSLRPLSRPDEPADKRPAPAPSPAPTGAPARRSSRSRRSHFRGHLDRERINLNCLLSLGVFLGAFALFFFAGKINRVPEHKGVAGLLFLLDILMVAGSLLLAIIGWRQCSRRPGGHVESKVIAGVTLLLGSCFGLLILIGLIATVPGRRPATAESPSQVPAETPKGPS